MVMKEPEQPTPLEVSLIKYIFANNYMMSCFFDINNEIKFLTSHLLQDDVAVTLCNYLYQVFFL